MRRPEGHDSSRSAPGGAEFRLEQHHPGAGTVVLAVFGDVDLHSAAALADALDAAIAGGAESIVVDLSRTTFVDSQGLGVLLRETRRFDPRGGSFRLVVPRTEIRRVFEVASLDRVFPLDASREEALARLPSRGPSGA